MVEPAPRYDLGEVVRWRDVSTAHNVARRKSNYDESRLHPWRTLFPSRLRRNQRRALRMHPRLSGTLSSLSLFLGKFKAITPNPRIRKNRVALWFLSLRSLASLSNLQGVFQIKASFHKS